MLDFLIGKSTTLGFNVTTPLPASPTYTHLAKIISLDGPGITVPDIEGGLLSSTFVPSRPGTPSGERSTMALQFDPDDPGFATINQWIASGNIPTVNWEIKWETGATTTFRGYVGGLTYKGTERDGRITYDVPLKVTSFPVTSLAPVQP